jgi:ribosome-associated toxin RatA of RatAB toxin-antitoxin module
MHRVSRSVLVPYSAGKMFDLVAGVDDYPSFLPWCAQASARGITGAADHADDGGVDVSVVEATISLAYRGVRSRFTTRNENRYPTSIRMTLVDGPFRRLNGDWTFTALREDACKVALLLQYEFAAGLLGKAIAPVFEIVAGSMVDAFARRAEELYAGTGS